MRSRRKAALRSQGSEVGFFLSNDDPSAELYRITVESEFLVGAALRWAAGDGSSRACVPAKAPSGRAVTIRLRPSGVHKISLATIFASETFRSSFLTISQIQSLAWSSCPRSERNARYRPSGDHAGSQLSPVPPVTFFESPEVTSRTKMSHATAQGGTPVSHSDSRVTDR